MTKEMKSIKEILGKTFAIAAYSDRCLLEKYQSYMDLDYKQREQGRKSILHWLQENDLLKYLNTYQISIMKKKIKRSGNETIYNDFVIINSLRVSTWVIGLVKTFKFLDKNRPDFKRLIPLGEKIDLEKFIIENELRLRQRKSIDKNYLYCSIFKYRDDLRLMNIESGIVNYITEKFQKDKLLVSGVKIDIENDDIYNGKKLYRDNKLFDADQGYIFTKSITSMCEMFEFITNVV